MKSLLNRTLKYAIIRYLMSVMLLLMSCKEKPYLRDFDTASWIGDKMGCSGFRGRLAEELVVSKGDFIGRREREITAFLGKPDRSDLYKRNQKFFIYYLDPGPGCTDESPDPQMLVVRINATGLCNEIFIQRGFATD